MEPTRHRQPGAQPPAFHPYNLCSKPHRIIDSINLLSEMPGSDDGESWTTAFGSFVDTRSSNQGGGRLGTHGQASLRAYDHRSPVTAHPSCLHAAIVSLWPTRVWYKYDGVVPPGHHCLRGRWHLLPPPLPSPPSPLQIHQIQLNSHYPFPPLQCSLRVSLHSRCFPSRCHHRHGP